MSNYKFTIGQINKTAAETAWNKIESSNLDMVKEMAESLGHTKADVENDDRLASAIWKAVKEKTRKTKMTLTVERLNGVAGTHRLIAPAAPAVSAPTPTTEAAPTPTTEAAPAPTTEAAPAPTTEAAPVVSTPVVEYDITLKVGNETFQIQGEDIYDTLDQIRQVGKRNRISNMTLNEVMDGGRLRLVDPEKIESGKLYKIEKPLSAAN